MKQQIVYNAPLAWLRGSLYFAVCFLISWSTGILQTLLTTPLLTPENLQNPTWIAFTLLCFVVIFVGYFIIWPKGTLTHGRELSWTAVLIFGLLWGVSEGQFFASIWSFFSQMLSPKWAVVLAAFSVISTFTGLWHALYWDIYVAPEHNIAAWNLKKVLFAHIPNISLSLIYLTLFESVGIFVLLQTIALLASTYFMCFPPFWKT